MDIRLKPSSDGSRSTDMAAVVVFGDQVVFAVRGRCSRQTFVRPMMPIAKPGSGAVSRLPFDTCRGSSCSLHSLTGVQKDGDRNDNAFVVKR